MGLADHLLTNLERKIASLELEPSDGGRFEVFVDGKQVYSKLQTGEFPDNAAILRTLEKRRA